MTLHFIKSLTETKDNLEIRQDKLKFPKDALDPVMSEATIKYHFDGLASKYFDRYNAGEGDADFNYGGAMLHNIWFSNLTPPRAANKPQGLSLNLIDSKYTSFDKFKEEFEKTHLKIVHPPIYISIVKDKIELQSRECLLQSYQEKKTYK